MAHVLRPLCVLALLIFTLFTNYKVFAEPTLTREELYSIRELFNSSLKQQTTPIIWKTAVIKPIPKIPQPSQHKDYRPIAITSCMCKLLEKLLKNYILSVTTLDDHQFAYRPRRSTQDAVLCLLTNIIQFIDLQASNYARCLYLDFSSAFNTINVDKLMLRLSHLNSNVSNWI